LAAELGVPVEELERELGRDVFRRGGFRCCTAYMAEETIAAHARRRERATAAERRKAAERRERFRKLAEQNPVRRGVKVEVPEDMLPVQCITGPAEYDGTYTARPSVGDWLFEGGEGGATFGPTPAQKLEQKARRERNRRHRGKS